MILLFFLFYSFDPSLLDSLYRNGEYDKLLEITTQIDTHNLSIDQKIELYKYKGIAHIAFRNLENAKECFRKILTYSPNFELEKIKYSPIIISVFEEVKRELENVKRIPKRTVDYPSITFEKIKFYEIFFPGLYQIRSKHKKTKGYFIMGTFLISNIGIIYSHLCFNKYYNAYLKEKNTIKIKSLYQKSLFYYRMRNISITFSLFIWFYHLYDLFH